MKISRIIIGIDDSKYSDHAAEYGFNLARMFNAEVGLVNVVEPVVVAPTAGLDVMGGIAPEASTINDLEILNTQNQLAETILDRTIKTYGGGITITQFSEFGSTAEGIINCSKGFNADLIVIGTHSRTGFDRLLMGSVAEHVVRYADVPVMVVPLPSERD